VNKQCGDILDRKLASVDSRQIPASTRCPKFKIWI